VILDALELAMRAPSLHNSQPWLWRVDEHRIRLYLDESRRLPATDPHDRELVISCGAALHHLLVALASQGRLGHVRRLPDPRQPSWLAEVALTAPAQPLADADLAEAIPRRRTDRRPFTCWPVPAELIGQLREMARIEGMALHPVTDPDQRWRVYQAITAADQQQTSDPAQAAELAAWSGRGPGAVDGVPSANVPPPARVPGQPPMRRFAHPEFALPPPGGEPEAAALLLLSTSTDTPLHWLRAGELTSAILLTATREGLASSPLTQPFEIADTREFLRARVTRSTATYPQILLRIGWPAPGAPQPPPTPRRGLSEVVTSLNEWRGI
jgi:nitroreductase